MKIFFTHHGRLVALEHFTKTRVLEFAFQFALLFFDEFLPQRSFARRDSPGPLDLAPFFFFLFELRNLMVDIVRYVMGMQI